MAGWKGEQTLQVSGTRNPGKTARAPDLCGMCWTAAGVNANAMLEALVGGMAARCMQGWEQAVGQRIQQGSVFVIEAPECSLE